MCAKTEGMEARQRGVSLMCNPYEFSQRPTIRANQWERGWLRENARLNGKCGCNQCISNSIAGRRTLNHGR